MESTSEPEPKGSDDSQLCRCTHPKSRHGVIGNCPDACLAGTDSGDPDDLDDCTGFQPWSDPAPEPSESDAPAGVITGYAVDYAVRGSMYRIAVPIEARVTVIDGELRIGFRAPVDGIVQIRPLEEQA